MPKDETGISRISERGDFLRIEGAHEGVRSDVTISKEQVAEYRQRYGEKATQEMFLRSLDGGREDRDYRDVRP